MIHLTIQQLSTLQDGELSEASAAHARQHVGACEECAEKLAALEALDASLRAALTQEPGEEFYENFPLEVGEKIRSLAATSAAAGAAASVPPPAGVRRGRVRGRVGPAPRFAAAALVVIIASAGVIVSHPREVTSWLDTLVHGGAPRKASGDRSALLPLDPQPLVEGSDLLPDRTDSPEPGPAPTRGRDSEDPWRAEEVTLADEASDLPGERGTWGADPAVDPTNGTATMRADELMAPHAADPFASLPPDLLASIRTAQRASQEAAADGMPARFDEAAGAWDIALEAMGGRPEQTLIRRSVAEARFRAWEAAPDDARSAAAKKALQTYLLFAPAGPDREKAAERLARIRG